MKDIVFICSHPLTLRNEKSFFIKELLEAGFYVEVWNVHKVFFPNWPLGTEETINDNYCIDIHTFDELINNLKKRVTGNTVFSIDTNIAKIYRYSAFFRLLKKNKCLTFFMEYNTKLMQNRITRFALLDLKGKTNMIKNAVSGRLKRLWKALFFDFTYDIIIGPNPPSNCTRKVFINYFDYEKYRIDSHLPDLINTKYAVFLDGYFPLHSAIAIYGPEIRNVEETKTRYLKLMCCFFSMIERQFNVKVVVAAHPSSKYIESDYGGRIVLKNKTCQLIQHAQFTIIQSSASVAFAILKRSPLLYCYTDDYKRYCHTDLLVSTAESQLLKTPFIQVEQFVADSALPIPEPHIDRDACEKYKYTYLTRPEIENRENKDIILDFFRSL